MTSKEINGLMELICRRPRHFFEPIAMVRDLVFFLRGVDCGACYPAHGPADDDCGFWNYAYRRYDRVPPPENCWTPAGFAPFLLEEFGDKQLFEVCETIADLFRDWRQLNEANENPLRF